MSQGGLGRFEWPLAVFAAIIGEEAARDGLSARILELAIAPLRLGKLDAHRTQPRLEDLAAAAEEQLHQHKASCGGDELVDGVEEHERGRVERVRVREQQS
eukprot:CAMPEP_0174732680 /NCGR_PEP_ID=MMETSP1094-20130205/59845_1 /TAXON_ID=156173 /ORGANISM="Chrysochromulina brevifilum, Strain UTEX LB 985" /LENGTH=100 /DNA_ID=CAMNT_0015935227 /DNA_START=285 /DNA_END=588 /DNA_ORIENTATION=-